MIAQRGVDLILIFTVFYKLAGFRVPTEVIMQKV